jgi:peptidyl-prolyl cis-trans isomerase D
MATQIQMPLRNRYPRLIANAMPPKGLAKSIATGTAMITKIRSIFNSRWGAMLALIFVGLIGLAFALGDVTGSGSFGGVGQGNVATIGGQKIGVGELQDAVDNRLRAERRENPTLDMGRFVESGGLDATLDQLINRYALAIYGEKYGIAVAETTVNQEILKLPGATGANGKFDAQAFERFLSGLKLTDKMVRDDFRQNFYARQMLSVAAPGSNAPASMALPYASLDLEKRSGEVAVIPATAFLPKAPPSEAALNQFYKANATRYTVPEQRAIAYAIFDASVVEAKSVPSAQEIAEYYKANASKYAASQSRDIAQLVFPSAAIAKANADKIRGGQSIDAVANELGLSVVRTSGATRESLTKAASKAVADAVFAAPRGGVAAPARGALGFYVVSVNAVKDIAARPLAVASADIARELKEQKRVELLGDLTGEIETAFDEGTPITDIAKAQGLKVQTTAKLLANGQDPANPAFRPAGDMTAIIPAAFQLETGGAGQLIELEAGKRFAMVAVADFDDAAPRPLAEIRDVVVQQWALAEGNKKAKAVAEEIRKAVAGGQTLSAALAAAGVAGSKIEPLNMTRGELNKQGQQVSPPVALMFAMKAGTAKALPAGGDRGSFVVRLNQVIRGDASGDTERLEANRKELQKLLAQEYAAQLILAAKEEMGVEKNEDAIKTLRDSLTGKNQGN